MFQTLTASDFERPIKFPNGTQEAKEINDFIQATNTQTGARHFRLELLGAELYAEIDTLDPLPQKYIDLLDGALFKLPNGEAFFHNGTEFCVKNMVWYSYYRDNYEITTTGATRNHNENSDRVNPYFGVRSAYNNAVIAYNNNLYCNTELFPYSYAPNYVLRHEFQYHNRNEAGVIDFIAAYTNRSEKITGFVQGATTATIQVETTKYIEDGDTVSINNIEYAVSNVVENVSFDIDNDDFEGADNYVFSPFSLFKGHRKAVITI